MYNNNPTTFFCVFGLIVVVLLIVLVVNLARRSQEEARQTEVEFIRILQSLPADKQMLFQMQFNTFKKNPTTAIILAIFLGDLGAHRFYLGETGAGIVYLLFFWTGIPGIIAIFEAFTLSGKINRLNLQKAREISLMVGGAVY